MPDNTEFPKATYRYDPYRNFKFRVKWDNKYVAGVSKVSALTHTTQVITHHSARDPSTPRRMPGQSEYPAITLERGVTHDVEFEQWANKVWDYHNSTIDDQQGGTDNQDVSLKGFRKTSSSRSITRQDRRSSPTTSMAVGPQNSREYPRWTPTATRSPSRS